MNIFQSRLYQINKANNGNQFKHSLNSILRDKSKTIFNRFDYQGFIFNGNVFSVNIPEEKFSNYLSSYNNELYRILKDILDELYKDNYSFLDLFDIDENNYSSVSESSKRLSRIIETSSGITGLSEINEMIPSQKYKQMDKRYKKLRFFVYVSEDGYIYLLLIDLYHLGIEAFNYDIGKYALDTQYKSVSKYNKCISKVMDDCIY